jgi:hypothetical protein
MSLASGGGEASSSSSSSSSNGTSGSNQGPTRIERAYDAASSVGTFFFGEAKTDADRIRESQRDLIHDARHFDRQRQLAARAEAAHQRKVDALIKRGQVGPELKQALREKQSATKQVSRAAAVSARLQNSAAAVGDTEAKLRILAAAGTQADALARANALLEEQGSAMELAETVKRENAKTNAQLKAVEDAFASMEEDPDSQDNRELETMYQQAVAAAILGQANAPLDLPTTSPVRDMPEYSDAATAAAAATSSESELPDDDAELMARVARLRQA